MLHLAVRLALAAVLLGAAAAKLRRPAASADALRGLVGAGGDLVWQDPEQVARAAVEAMIDGRRTVTPGLTNKLTALGWRLAPRTALLPAARALGRLAT